MSSPAQALNPNWYARPAVDGATFLQNVGFGDSYYLEGQVQPYACEVLQNEGFFTGQVWSAPVIPSAAPARRFTNQSFGDSRSLDSPAVAGAPPTPMMSETSDGPGQQWSSQRWGPRYGEVEGSIRCGGESADVFTVTGPGALRVVVQPVDPMRTFDPTVHVSNSAASPFDPLIGTGDDETPCFYPPSQFACPDLTVQIAAEVAVLLLGLDACNPSGTGSYSARFTLDGKPYQPTQVGDDLTYP